MKAVQKLLGKMRRRWMVEHFARGGLLVIGLAINAALVCLLLHQLANLPAWSLYAAAGLALAGLGILAATARAKAPSALELSQLLDERAGTDDLFTSALEFHARPERFGWLGEETWRKAAAEAQGVALPARWSVGRLRNWSAMGGLAGMLAAAILTVGWLQGRKSGGEVVPAMAKPAARPVVVATAQSETKPVEKPIAETPATVLPEATTQAAEKPGENTVKITNEMIEKYLEQMPGQEQVDLTGVTPIRWDQDEASGKNNPQEQNHVGEKIDPVRLDAALLKDLQIAKKTKEEGGGSKEGGVDIAVMSNQGDLKAKGKTGGAANKESLADAVSKDPRGESSRMTAKPAQKALPIRSAEKVASRQKGENRPMSLLDFMAALERAKALPEPGPAAAKPVDHPEDHVVRQESVSDDEAALTQSYFDLLRKADR